MRQYLNLLEKVLKEGKKREPAREGMPGSLNLFGESIEVDLRDGFPLLTTKKMFYKGIFAELLWFLRGEPNLYYLWLNKTHIWDQDAYRRFSRETRIGNGNSFLTTRGSISDYNSYRLVLTRLFENGTKGDIDQFKRITDMGAVYPVQWRGGCTFRGTAGIRGDQIAYIIKNMILHPNSRYHLVSAWNGTDVSQNENYNIMALPPCHLLHQIQIDGEYFDMIMYQRSADIFLGVPFNIASYAALMQFYSKITGLIPRVLKMFFGSVDLYLNHIDAAEEQLSRTPGKLPEMDLVLSDETWKRINDLYASVRNIEESKNDFTTKHVNHIIFSIKPSDFRVTNYNPQDAIKAELSTGIKVD